ALQRLAGCDAAGLAVLLGGLGFRVTWDGSDFSFAPRPGRRNGVASPVEKAGAKRRRPKAAQARKRKPDSADAISEDSPFAKLRELKFAR
ncbi:MAG: hypothetical protein ACFCUQ_20980, partial [Kiloniellales bacterium]